MSVIHSALRIAREGGGSLETPKPKEPHFAGALHSSVAGRTDHLPVTLESGAYVIPADIISGMGEGNTIAGFKHARRMFGGKPYGAKSEAPYGQGKTPYGMASGGVVDDTGVISQIVSAMKAHGKPGHYGLRVDEADGPHGSLSIGDSVPVSRQWRNSEPTKRNLIGSSAIRVARHENGVKSALDRMNLLKFDVNKGYYPGDYVHLIHSPHAPTSGADSGEGVFKNATLVGRWKKKDDGQSPIEPNGMANGGKSSGVPIVAAGGEFVLTPDQVREVGGGDLDTGHAVLDKFVIRMRKELIHTLKHLKPPKKD